MAADAEKLSGMEVDQHRVPKRKLDEASGEVVDNDNAKRPSSSASDHFESPSSGFSSVGSTPTTSTTWNWERRVRHREKGPLALLAEKLTKTMTDLDKTAQERISKIKNPEVKEALEGFASKTMQDLAPLVTQVTVAAMEEID